jgi:hypothetical protein
MEMAASLGVVPWLEPMTPVPGSLWEERHPYSADRMIPLYEKCLDSIERNGLDLSVTKAGCVRVGVYCALKDIQRYGG